jgi:hypothetical protein
MSDDDPRRETDPGRHPGEPGGAAEQRTPPSVSDETQPITGGSSPPSGPAPPSPPDGPPTYEPTTGPGAVPPPQNPYAEPDQASPYSQQQGPYGGQPSPPPNPYAAGNDYGAPHSPYGAPYQPAYAGGALADHPSATTAMVLGIIGLVGIAVCGGITLVLSPFAWVMGARAVREIDGSPGRYGGRDRAQAGKIMGIIGTVLLILAVLAIIAFIVLLVAVGTSSSSPSNPSPLIQTG